MAFEDLVRWSVRRGEVVGEEFEGDVEAWVAERVRRHRAGDRVLVEVARRLQGCVRTSDTVARYGGDEFVVILPDLQQAEDANAVAAKIHAAIALPLQQPVPGLCLSCSIGIALFPEYGDAAEALLKEADDTMYCSKRKFGERPALR